MPGQISLDSIVAASLKAATLAQKDYEAWTGEWLWQAPEYLLTTYVARELAKLEVGITLENGATTAIVDANARIRGRSHSAIREGGRFDILVWTAGGVPRAPIEVKRNVTRLATILDDLWANRQGSKYCEPSNYDALWPDCVLYLLARRKKLQIEGNPKG